MGRVKSEFGRGYKTSLIQFVFHEPRLDETEAIYAKMRAEHPELKTFNPEDAAEMFANGAYDHLADLIKPKSMVSNQEWARAKAIRDRAYRMGRVWDPGDAGTPDEARALIAEARRLLGNVTTFEAAYKWDTDHGIKPSPGYSASCTRPIPRRLA